MSLFMDTMGSAGRFLRDRAYDTVYEVGDTALQFIGDMLRPYNEDRQNAFSRRQIDRYERKNLPKAARRKTEQPRATEKPLAYDQKAILVQMMAREPDESIIEHWKRRKQLLAAPDKPALIGQYQALQDRMATEQQHEGAIQAEMRQLSVQYQAARVQNPARKRQRAASQRR